MFSFTSLGGVVVISLRWRNFPVLRTRADKCYLRTESRIATDGASYYLTDLSHRFIWWQCKDDVTRLADLVQRIQIRRIERDVFETEELTRRCLKLLSGGGGGGGGDDGGGSGGSDGSDSGDGGGLRKRRKSGGGVSVKSRRSMSLPPVARAPSVSRVGGGREPVVEEREAVKVRGDTTTDGERPTATRRERERDRGSRYEVVRPERDSSGRIVVDVGGAVDVERWRNRDRDRDWDRDRPAPVYVERERERSRYGDRDRERYR
jgi:hypothetical protein